MSTTSELQSSQSTTDGLAGKPHSRLGAIVSALHSKSKVSNSVPISLSLVLMIYQGGRQHVLKVESPSRKSSRKQTTPHQKTPSKSHVCSNGVPVPFMHHFYSHAADPMRGLYTLKLLFYVRLGLGKSAGYYGLSLATASATGQLDHASYIYIT